MLIIPGQILKFKKPASVIIKFQKHGFSFTSTSEIWDSAALDQKIMYFQLKFQGLMKLFSPKFTDLIFHFVCVSHFTKGGWGGRWCDGAGKLPVPGRPTIWITVGQGPTALTVGWARGCLDIFTLIYPFFPLSPSLWETIRYRLNYCLKGPLNPKNNQPTNYQGGGGGGGGGNLRRDHLCLETK